MPVRCLATAQAGRVFSLEKQILDGMPRIEHWFGGH
jgi:hypothetical protein